MHPPMCNRAALGVLLALHAASGAPPNLIVALVDDLGGYNVPWRNPEQHGARLKEFVETEGVQLERFYTYQFCSPTRCSLLSGRLPYHVNEYNPVALEDRKGGIHPDMTILPAKLKLKNYSTAMIGKGHLGARSAAFLPINRGFDHHLGFLGGGEDHNTQINGNYVDLWLNDAPAYGRNGTLNSCYLYGGDAVDQIMQHDMNAPFFMYLAYQNVHEPYTPLPEYIDPSIPSPRRAINAMMSCVADSTMNITDALKARGMWDNTLMIWSSDNGGPQYWQGNNWPLRGGKGTDFEGGVRTAAFAAGGLLAAALRGEKLHTVMHISDVYTTFCSLAGLTAAEIEDDVPGLPGVDGLDLGTILTAGTPDTARPNQELVLSSQAYLDGDYKFIIYTRALIKTQWFCFFEHNATGCGYWTDPLWPTSSAQSSGHRPDEFDLQECNDGCLFHVVNDPSEHHDLSAAEPARFAAMKARHAELLKTAYQTEGDFGYTNCVTTAEYVAAHRGFGGPPCTK